MVSLVLDVKPTLMIANQILVGMEADVRIPLLDTLVSVLLVLLDYPVKPTSMTASQVLAIEENVLMGKIPSHAYATLVIPDFYVKHK